MDNHAHNESGSCDCAYVCKDCDDNVNWCCEGCSNHFCIICEEQEDGIHRDGLHLFCSECYEEVVEEQQKGQYEAVMEELVQKMAHSGI